MGGMAMGECQNWQRMSCITQKICKHTEGGYGRLPLGDVYICHGIFQKCTSLKKPIPKHFFTSLLQDLSTKNLVSLGNLLSTKFMKPSRWLYATLGRWTWVPQDLKNKVLKQPLNRQMKGPAQKPQDVYDTQKKDVPTID